MAEFLLELLSEEIPARMQARAADELRRLMLDGLEEAGLTYENTQSFATPRRLVLVVDGLPQRQPDRVEERKGPKVGAPEKAMEGFLRSTGLTLDQCEQRDTAKGPVWFAVMDKPGEDTQIVLAELIARAVSEFRWPMSMRWGETTGRWVRPLQGILALLDGTVINGSTSLGPKSDFTFGSSTVGHRFLSGGPFEVSSFVDYRDKLRASGVLLDPVERQSIIRDKSAELASQGGFAVRPDEDLVIENAGLTEWPVPMMGSIDHEFMDVPSEALITSMKTHQRYFALQNKDGSLAPRFVFVANTEAADGGATIIAGNERVLRARLADAKFFWDQDRAVKLADRGEDLASVTFHAKLGTMAEKVQRLQTLAVSMADHIANADTSALKRAAQLAKCDLSSGMVGEFPELQGTMGFYYATHDGESGDVAQAIADHYSPQGPNDNCPTAPVSVGVALADRLDTLAGFFAIGEKPTGSRDPFALRRAALGVIRLVVENNIAMPLRAAFNQAVSQYKFDVDTDALTDELVTFIADRLKVAFREQGVRHDLVDAVLALRTEDDLVRVKARVSALTEFLDGEVGSDLLTAYRRAANIGRIEAKKDGRPQEDAVDKGLLQQEEERELSVALSEVGDALSPVLEKANFGDAMQELARLRSPVDAFFDQVTVNADEPELRRNRLALLHQITTTMNQVADFSLVAG